jgi:predicted phage-related endonuclease
MSEEEKKTTGEVVTVEEPDGEAMKTLQEIAGGEITIDVIKSKDFVNAYPMLNKALDMLGQLKASIDAKMKEAIRTEYLKDGTNKVETDTFTVTFVAGSIRKTFDSKKLKEDHPDVYEQYAKESLASDSIRIKFAEEGGK